MRVLRGSGRRTAAFTDRDFAILRFVGGARYATSKSIEIAFGMSGAMAHRRLRAMASLSLIEGRQELPNMPAFYALRDGGRRELAHIYPDRAPRPARGMPRQRDHHTAIVELFAKFLFALGKSKLARLESHYFSHDLRRRAGPIIPDIVLDIRVRRREGQETEERVQLCIEVDLGGVSPSRMAGRAQSYAFAFRQSSVDRRLLIAGATARRRNRLFLALLDARDTPSAYYGVLDQVGAHDVLNGAWLRAVIDEQGVARLVPASPIALARRDS
jgi:hypothetical protein